MSLSQKTFAAYSTENLEWIPSALISLHKIKADGVHLKEFDFLHDPHISNFILLTAEGREIQIETASFE
jgi:hypothetical protein